MMHRDEEEEKLLRSVTLQNARAVHSARERAERDLISAKEELERKIEELAQQREFFRVTLSSIGDGVIATDTEGRVSFLNPMAEGMTGWKADEAIGQPLENVFKIIHEESRKPAANPVSKVLREERVVGQSNHTRLIARDGTETPIADSAAPIRDAAGKITGVVMVFHDVTDQREAENALREARVHLEKRVEERTAELKAANENLRDLSARLLRIRDDESRRLARELHDSVGQMITAIGMNLSTVRSQTQKLDEKGAQAVEENMVLVGQMSSEIRTISYLLHPPLLDELGLRSAVEWYVQGFSERSTITTDLEIPKAFGRLSTNLETAIFRIVQECLTNIHRHSGSTTAAIRIFQENDQIVIVAQDWGKGISADKLRVDSKGLSGVGFRGMRERLRHLGGSLDIQSKGEGTVVTARLPIAVA